MKRIKLNQMANGHGGARPGSGRKPSLDHALRVIPGAMELLGTGITPIEVMIICMRRSWDRLLLMEDSMTDSDIYSPEKIKERSTLENEAFERASAVAPYIHPKLTATKVEGVNSTDQAQVKFLPEDTTL